MRRSVKRKQRKKPKKKDPVAEEKKLDAAAETKEVKEKREKAEKGGEISEDDRHTQENHVQKLTDEFVKKVDDALSHKEREITHV